MTAGSGRRLGWVLALVLTWTGLALLAQPTTASGAEPWVDATFGTDGTVQRTNAGSLTAEVVGQAKAPDGDLVMAVQPAHTFWGCCLARVGRWSLARVTSTGAPVTSFGEGGVVQPELDAQPDSVAAIRLSDVAVDPSDRVLVSGTRGEGSTATSVVMRRTATGALDTAYGASGLATLPTPSVCSETPTADALLTDDTGRATVVGSCYDSSGFSVVIVRLTAVGSPDTGFSGDGVRTIRLPEAVGACCNVNVQRLSDGRLVIAMGSNDGAVVRTLATGAPDTTFSGDGVVLLDPSNTYGGASSVLAADDGSFLTVGTDGRVYKYSASGVQDTAYGTSGDGWAVFDQPDGCRNPWLVDLAGTVARPIGLTSCSETMGLSALGADGSPDTAFGVRATQVRTLVGDSVGEFGRTLLADGSGLLLTGASPDSSLRVERRSASGALDTAYGTAGATELDVRGRLFSLEGGSSAVDAQGRVLTAVVVDNRGVSDEHAILVTRHLSTGAVDTTFGDGGTATVEGGGHSPGWGEEVQRPHVVANGDGSVTLVARWKNEGLDVDEFAYGFLTARLTPSGAPDTATVPGGVRVAKIPGMIESRDSRGGVAPTSGGVLVPLETGDGHPAVAKLLPSGALDTSFAAGGVRTLPDATFGGNVDLHPAPGGAALLTWHELPSSGDFTTDFVVARVTSGGLVDSTYGSAGRFRRAEIEPIPVATSLPTGELVYGWGQGRSVQLWRVTAGGAADPTFGTSGVATLSGPSGTAARLNDLMGTSSGTEVALTSISTTTEAHQAMLGRLSSTGTPASDFGTSGVARAFALPAKEEVSYDGQWISALPGGATALSTLSSSYLTGSPSQVRLTKMRPNGTGGGGGGGGGTPTLTGPSGTVVTTSAAYSWSGLTAPYTVETSTAPTVGSFGSWLQAPSTSQTSSTLSVTAGTSTCVRVRSGSAVTPTSCVTSPLTASSMTSKGTWKTVTASGYYRGSARKATARGARLSSAVTASGLDLVATRCGTCGTVAVLWDGVKIKSISLKGTSKKRVVFPIVTWPDVRSGTVALKVTTSGKSVVVEGLAARRADAP